jgi:hypothetical protein
VLGIRININTKSVHIKQYGVNFSIKNMAGLNIPISATFWVITAILAVINTVTLLDRKKSMGEMSIIEK